MLEVHWHADDALARPLVVSRARARTAAPQTRAVALANVVLADHGASVEEEPLDPPQPAAGPPLPAPAAARPAWRSPTRRPCASRLGAAVTTGAGALARPDPRAARAALTLDDGERTVDRRARTSSASGRLDAHVVVEPEPDGVARLRFGDGVTGRTPDRPGHVPARATGSAAGGSATSRAGRLTHWLPRADGTPAIAGALLTVWNPLPADRRHRPRGRWSWSASSRRSPTATSCRAVTTGDYAAAAESVAGVQRSVDRRRWTGLVVRARGHRRPAGRTGRDPAVSRP